MNKTIIAVFLSLTSLLCCRGDDGLLLRWDFSQVVEGKVKDVSGNGHDGVAVALEREGAVAMMRDGLSRVSCPLSGLHESFSVTLWIKPLRLRDHNQHLRIGSVGPGYWAFDMVAGHDGYVFCGVENVTRFGPETLKPGTMEVGKWQFFVYVFDRTAAGFYRDGRLLAQGRQRWPDTWKDFSFGEAECLVSEIALYDHALTQAQILALWNDGNKPKKALP